LNVEFGAWSEPRPGSPHEFYAAVWTQGGSGAGGLDIYAAATPTASRINGLCRRIVQRGVSSAAALRPPLIYRGTDSGNAYFVDSNGVVTPGSPLFPGRIDPIAERHGFGLGFSCSVAKRVVVHAHELGRQGGYYVSVRSERSRKLIALAILERSGDSSFRVSKGCQQD
jgi:hypothetical protein